MAEFFTGPSVRFYATFFGLYHGAIYDEAVFVEAPYLWFRAWNASGFAALLVGVDGLRARLPRWCLALAGAAGVAWLALLVPVLNPGFIVTTGLLDRRLPAAATCEHFVVHARAGGPAERLAEAACRDLEFRLAQQREILNLTPTRTYHAYLYDNPRHKASLMGAGRTSIAKPWQGQLHIVFTAVSGRVLAHELAHLYMAEASTAALGIPMRGVLPVAGLLEGIAVALEPPRPLAPLHDWAAAVRRTMDTPAMASLMEPAGFWSHSGGKAYTLTGSFIRWLMETRGGDAVVALYDSADFEDVGAVAVLEEEWGAAMDAREVSPDILALAGFIYDRPAVFRKRCPFAVGRCAADAARLLRHEGPEAALPLVRRAVAYDPGRLDGLLRLSRVLAATGEAEAARDVLALAGDREGLSEIQRASLRLARIDALLMEGKNAEARTEIAALPAAAARLWRDALLLRSRLADPGGPAADDVPGLLNLASRAARRTRLGRLMESPNPAVACLAVALLMRVPAAKVVGEADAARCLEASIGPAGRCQAAAAARLAAWMRGDPDAALRWQNYLEGECADTEIIRSEEILDWRQRLEWERLRG